MKAGYDKRYAAMKKYFIYRDTEREYLKKPCKVIFEDKNYTSFTNAWSLVLTTEDTGEIKLFDDENCKYPDILRFIKFDGIKKKIDIRKVLEDAKNKGYQLSKSAVRDTFNYLLLYDEAYYNIGLLDISFAIIDDGEISMTYHPYGYDQPLMIQTSLGLCLIMPVKYEGDPEADGRVVIRE